MTPSDWKGWMRRAFSCDITIIPGGKYAEDRYLWQGDKFVKSGG